MKDYAKVHSKEAGLVVYEASCKGAVVCLALGLDVPLISSFQERKGQFHGKEIRHKNGYAGVQAQGHGVDVGVGSFLAASGLGIVFSIAEAAGETGFAKQRQDAAVKKRDVAAEGEGR